MSCDLFTNTTHARGPCRCTFAQLQLNAAIVKFRTRLQEVKLRAIRKPSPRSVSVRLLLVQFNSGFFCCVVWTKSHITQQVCDHQRRPVAIGVGRGLGYWFCSARSQARSKSSACMPMSCSATFAPLACAKSNMPCAALLACRARVIFSIALGAADALYANAWGKIMVCNSA